MNISSGINSVINLQYICDIIHCCIRVSHKHHCSSKQLTMQSQCNLITVYSTQLLWHIEIRVYFKNLLPDRLSASPSPVLSTTTDKLLSCLVMGLPYQWLTVLVMAPFVFSPQWALLFHPVAFVLCFSQSAANHIATQQRIHNYIFTV